MLNVVDIEIVGNFSALCRERGKIVPGTRREGHNVFTSNGRNWLSKLIAWQTIGSTDAPYTRRRARWMGVGTGSQFEVTTVAALNAPALVNATDYLATIDSVTFPTLSSVKFTKEFAGSEISFSGSTVEVTEAGLYVDVNPAEIAAPCAAYTGTEDAEASGETTTLDPNVGSNPPVAYKVFEALPKTPDFILEINWEFRF